MCVWLTNETPRSVWRHCFVSDTHWHWQKLAQSISPDFATGVRLFNSVCWSSYTDPRLFRHHARTSGNSVQNIQAAKKLWWVFMVAYKLASAKSNTNMSVYYVDLCNNRDNLLNLLLLEEQRRSSAGWTNLLTRLVWTFFALFFKTWYVTCYLGVSWIA